MVFPEPLTTSEDPSGLNFTVIEVPASVLSGRERLVVTGVEPSLTS